MSEPAKKAHGSLTSYIIGLILSLILTAIAFGFVMSAEQMTTGIVAIILVCAVAQVLIQVIFFLHMNGSHAQVWDTTAGIYTLAILLFIVLASMWIFHHLHVNTMMVGH